MYVYKRTEPGLWTVGHHAPGGVGPNRDFHPESDHGSEKDAAERVHWLNGGLARREVEQMIESHILAHTEGAPHYYPDGSSA